MLACEQQENSIPLLLKIVPEVVLYVWHFARFDLELVVSHVHHPNVLHVVFLYEGVDKPRRVSGCKKDIGQSSYAAQQPRARNL